MCPADKENTSPRPVVADPGFVSPRVEADNNTFVPLLDRIARTVGSVVGFRSFDSNRMKLDRSSIPFHYFRRWVVVGGRDFVVQWVGILLAWFERRGSRRVRRERKGWGLVGVVGG